MDEASSSCTLTERLQSELERVVGSLYEVYGSASNKERTELLTLCMDEHETYLLKGFRRLSSGFTVLDSSRPWLCYWIVHSLALMGSPIDQALYNRSVSFLEHCQDPQGGYGGGPGQMAHLATTYAAVCALVTLGGEKALASINREKILQYLLRMKDPCGGFRVHDNGEMDMRGSYTALAVAHMLDIMVPELLENVGEFVRSCQTYEGGIGGEPGAEAHGGYTFCGLAALALVNQMYLLDLPSLANWVVFRQGKVEGGFQGRTNKLVDGCYSFWQGGCFQVLQQYMPHLWAQQSSSLAALDTNHGGSEVLNTASEGTRDDMREVSRKEEGDGAKVGLQEYGSSSKISADLGKGATIDIKTLSEALNATYAKLKSGSEGVDASNNSGESSSKFNPEKMHVEDGEEYYSPSKEFPSQKDWGSDDDAREFWDSDYSTGQGSADKLFPMVEIGFHREPHHVTCVEVVELPQDGVQDFATGPSGSSGNSRSTIEFDSPEECLYGPIFNSQALQGYILLCCQELYGGLRDKPGKNVDYYHTCYCLSGLSGAQYSTAHRVGAPPPPSGVLGPYSNLLEATHALCNVQLDRYYEARSFFQRC